MKTFLGLFVETSMKLCKILKKNGVLLRDKRRMKMFREALEFFQLIDVGYFDRWFTWERGNLLDKTYKIVWTGVL